MLRPEGVELLCRQRCEGVALFDEDEVPGAGVSLPQAALQVAPVRHSARGILQQPWLSPASPHTLTLYLHPTACTGCLKWQPHTWVFWPIPYTQEHASDTLKADAEKPPVYFYLARSGSAGWSSAGSLVRLHRPLLAAEKSGWDWKHKSRRQCEQLRLMLGMDGSGRVRGACVVCACTKPGLTPENLPTKYLVWL